MYIIVIALFWVLLIEYDCPIFNGLYTYISSVTGATVAMATLLGSGDCDVAINWYGGWHHGKK